MMINHWILFLVPFLISLSVTPIIRKFALKAHLVAQPREDRWHQKPTALFGGIAIYLAYLVSCLLFLSHIKGIFPILIGGGLFFAIGLFDDVKKFSAQTKLLFQIIISCLVIYFGILIPLPYAYISIPLTVIWILLITNSFNLLDNMDGLSCGIASIVSLMVYFSGLVFKNNSFGPFALILAGATLGFLPYNFNPAKIFMGDCGSMFIGFTLAALAISETLRPASNVIITLLIPVLLMAIPIFDTTLVALMRIFHGRSILKGGRDHASHRLVSLGLSERKTVILLCLLSALFGLIALSYSKWDFFITSVLVGLTVVVLVFFGMFLAEIKTYDTGIYEEERRRKQSEGKLVLNSIILNKRRIVEVFADFVLICIAYYGAHLLRFEGQISDGNLELIRYSLPWVIFFRIGCFWYFGLYRGMWRYVGISDLVAIFKAATLSSVFTVITLTFLFRFANYSRVVFIIDWLLVLFFIAGIRILIRLLHEYFSSLRKGKNNVLIFGAGDMGESVLRELRRNKNLNYNPIGFIDDDIAKVGRRIHGIQVLGRREDLAYLLKNHNVDEVLIAVSLSKLKDSQKLFALLKDFSVSYRELIGIFDK